MKRYALLLLLAAALAGITGCNQEPEGPTVTQIPPPPTVAATEVLVLPTPGDVTAEATTVFATAPALATVAASPTVEATDPPTEEPATAEATASPTTDLPTAAPTATAEPTAETGSELFAPGQVDGMTLTAGGSQAYVVEGRRFQPVILFVEPDNTLDVALAAYSGDLGGQATPGGLTPLASADNQLAGRPEILVLSPEADGRFTVVVRAVSGEGNYAAHLFDLTTPAPGVAIQQPDTLAGGTEKVYAVASRGARPVIAVADPTDQSDIALDIISDEGTLLTTANYSGPGGAETAYVLPLGAGSYSVKVREVNGGPSAFSILVITME